MLCAALRLRDRRQRYITAKVPYSGKKKSVVVCYSVLLLHLPSIKIKWERMNSKMNLKLNSSPPALSKRRLLFARSLIRSHIALSIRRFFCTFVRVVSPSPGKELKLRQINAYNDFNVLLRKTEAVRSLCTVLSMTIASMLSVVCMYSFVCN